MESASKDYDYDKSTEDNHSADNSEFVGTYADIRSQLDYDYHKRYTKERQLFHDSLIDLLVQTNNIIDKVNGITCETPADSNWMVFTAGSMGVGKGHAVRWLERKGLFPLSSFVIVDPDIIRKMLPESAAYHDRDPNTAGGLTQKEVGYVSEVLTLHALKKHKNVLVDGSLRDGDWYNTYLTDLTQGFSLRIGIIHVTARLDTILNRVARRAQIEGRTVPADAVMDSMEKIPQSIQSLSRFMDMYACFTNENDNAAPLCRRLWIKGKSGRSLSMDLRSPPPSAQKQRDGLACQAREGGSGGSGDNRCEDGLNGNVDEDGVINTTTSSTSRDATTASTPDAAVMEASGSRPPSSAYSLSPFRYAMFEEPPIHLDMEHYNQVINDRQTMKFSCTKGGFGQQQHRPFSIRGAGVSILFPNKGLISSCTEFVSSSSSISSSSASAACGCDQATPSAPVDSDDNVSRPPSSVGTTGRESKASRDNKPSTPEMDTSGLSAEDEFNTWAADFREIFAQSCAVGPDTSKT